MTIDEVNTGNQRGTTCLIEYTAEKNAKKKEKKARSITEEFTYAIMPAAIEIPMAVIGPFFGFQRTCAERWMSSAVHGAGR
jgi:hypothetical protein